MAIDYNQYEELELIELIASYEGNVASEDELSKLFDDMYADHIRDERLEDDEPYINELFSNWADALCRGGEIHQKQYHEYCYVGEFA